MRTEILLTALLVTMCLSSCVSVRKTFRVHPFAVRPTSDALKHAAKWSAERVRRGGEDLPFSFMYDGKPSNELLAAWPSKTKRKRLDSSRKQRTTTWTDPQTLLEVRCVAVEYCDFPVVEWTVYFRNTGEANTPILENIQGLDTMFQRGEEGEFVLRGIKGDFCSMDSFMPYELTLKAGDKQQFAPPGGRPTDREFPYYNVLIPGGGVMFSIGWPGQWASSFVRDDDKGLHVRAGQELTHLYLKPGEEIRTPLTVMMFYVGDDIDRSQNLWRRWMLAHNTPQHEGEQVGAIFSSANVTVDHHNRSEVTEKQGIDLLMKEGVTPDYWWIDAGWYYCNGSWWNTGTWEVDHTRYPNGIKPVSDYVHERGMKLILWFEPERVRQGLWIYNEHPEWLVSGGNYSKMMKMGEGLLTNPVDGLLNLGDEKVRMWLTDHTDKIIKTQGVDFFRSDFNTDPLGWWRGADAPDRQGICENLYVQGYLAYWDELLRRNPGLRIDSCASGGRRNDLETLRRSVPLLRSDFQRPDDNLVYATGNQGHTYGLSMWIPSYGTGIAYTGFEHSVYSIRSYMCPSLLIGADTRKPNIDWDVVRRQVEQFRLVAPCMLGDYYPLTPHSLDEYKWIAWQFNRPEEGDGIVQAFKGTRGEQVDMLCPLHGLDPDGEYIVTNFDVGEPKKITGKELMGQGLQVEIKATPGSALFKYRETGRADSKR